MPLSIKILNRAKKYGYVMWNKENDFEIRNYLKDRKSVHVTFDGKDLGVKNIDWKYRRISLGASNTRDLPPEKEQFVLTLYKDGRLIVKCQ